MCGRDTHWWETVRLACSTPEGPQARGETPHRSWPCGPSWPDYCTVKAASQQAVQAQSGSEGHFCASKLNMTLRKASNMEKNKQRKGNRHAERRKNLKHRTTTNIVFFKISFKREPGRGRVEMRMPWKRNHQRIRKPVWEVNVWWQNICWKLNRWCQGNIPERLHR